MHTASVAASVVICRPTMEVRRVVMQMQAIRTILLNWFVGHVAMWPGRKCAQNMGLTFWSTSVATVVQWPCSSALGPRTFAIPATTTFSGSPFYPKESCLCVLPVLFTFMRQDENVHGFLMAGPRATQLEGDECPLHVKHPATGEEFALGCGVCRNAHTF